jgi:uncharacterized protein YjbI with pentapeptide repeats
MNRKFFLLLVIVCARSLYGDYEKFATLDIREKKFIGSLKNANFQDALLYRVTFVNADLTNANFTNARLRYVVFIDTNLSHANFTNAQLIAENTFMGVLSQPILFIGKTDLSDAKFIGSRIRNGDFSDLELHNVDFTGAYLENTKFNSSKLYNVIFKNAHCCSASFKDSSLEKCNFTAAYLWKTDFSDANFDDVEFSNKVITYDRP